MDLLNFGARKRKLYFPTLMKSDIWPGLYWGSGQAHFRLLLLLLFIIKYVLSVAQTFWMVDAGRGCTFTGRVPSGGTNMANRWSAKRQPSQDSVRS